MSYVCREHTRRCGLQGVKRIVILRLSSLLFLKSHSIRAAKTRHSGAFLAAYFCVEQLLILIGIRGGDLIALTCGVRRFQHVEEKPVQSRFAFSTSTTKNTNLS